MNDERIRKVLVSILSHNEERAMGHLRQQKVTLDEIDIVCSKGLVTRGGRVTLKGHVVLQSDK